MDSTNAYTQNSSFLNLLNSLPNQDNNNLHPIHYESLSPTVHLGSSEVPLFPTDDQIEDVEERKERRKWLPKEDLVLISAWLNTSKDPIVGNEQKAGAFWKRIESYFNSRIQLLGLPPRKFSHCKQRWGRINDHVCKFLGCYEAAMKELSSGQNDNDLMKAANDLFFNDHHVKFTLEHAWRELRHDQKRASTSSHAKDGGGKSKRRKVDEGSAQSSTSEPVSLEEDEVRVGLLV